MDKIGSRWKVLLEKETKKEKETTVWKVLKNGEEEEKEKENIEEGNTNENSKIELSKKNEDMVKEYSNGVIQLSNNEMIKKTKIPEWEVIIQNENKQEAENDKNELKTFYNEEIFKEEKMSIFENSEEEKNKEKYKEQTMKEEKYKEQTRKEEKYKEQTRKEETSLLWQKAEDIQTRKRTNSENDKKMEDLRCKQTNEITEMPENENISLKHSASKVKI